MHHVSSGGGTGIIMTRHMTAHHVQLKDYMCGFTLDKYGIWFGGSWHTLAKVIPANNPIV